MGRTNAEATDQRALKTISLTDPAENTIGTTAILDSYSGVIITTTTTGVSQVLGTPTNTDAIKRFSVVNNDTSTDTISINGTDLPVGEKTDFIWDGTAWTNAGGGGAGGDFLADGSIPMTGAIDQFNGANIASATTTDIGAATGNSPHITGTTTITGLGTIQAGVQRELTFDGILILTHNATSLILPTGANITTAAGDTCLMISEGSGNWRCVNYQRADGTALTSAGGGVSEIFNVYLSTNYTLTGSSAIVPFDTELIDTGSNFNTSNNNFTVPSDGIYQFNLTPAIFGLTDLDAISVQLFKNGSEITGGTCASGPTLLHTLTYIVDLTTSDVLDFRISNLTAVRGTLFSGTARTKFSGYKLN